MTDSTMHELHEAAPAAFVNGDATHRDQPGRGSQRVPKGGARRRPAQYAPHTATTAEGAAVAWHGGLGAALRLQEAWRHGIATVAHEQVAFVADACSGLAATGRDILAEPEPARRVELAWTQALLQLERSLQAAGRVMEVMGSTGQALLDAVVVDRNGPG